VQRILVEHSVYGKFTDLLVEGVKQLKTGDPLDESTDVGPLIRNSDAVRTTAWVEEAVARRRAPALRRRTPRIWSSSPPFSPAPSPR
jgi:acyl-CoA reductase-like NAD-dependent aldehyde dehydrogenase